MLNGSKTGFGKGKKEDWKFIHGVSDSLWMTIVSVAVLAFCELRGGSTFWVHYMVFGAGYAVLFCACCFIEKFGETGWRVDRAAVWNGSRFTVCVVGFGAVLLGSPVLLEISPDIVAVAGALGGSIDGAVVGRLARKTGCSTGRAAAAALFGSNDGTGRPS